MNPEVVALRNQYIESKKSSRSFWGNLGVNLTVGFGWVMESINQRRFLSNQERIESGLETPDEKMKRLGVLYEDKRDQFIAYQTLEEVIRPQGQSPENLADYKAQIGTVASEKLVHEIKELGQAELDSNRTSTMGFWYKDDGRFYRNPWIRAGVGLSLNIAGGFAAGLGLVPVSVGLYVYRHAFGILGTEGTIHGVQDHISYLNGIKSQYHATKITSEQRSFQTPEEKKVVAKDIAHSFSFLAEDRIKKNKDYGNAAPDQQHDNGHNQPHGHDNHHAHGGHGHAPARPTTEEFLHDAYQKRMKEIIALDLNDQPESYARALKNILRDFDQSTNYQNQAVKADRNTAALRWGISFFAADILTLFLSPDKFGPFPSLHNSGARPGWWTYKWPGGC